MKSLSLYRLILIIFLLALGAANYYWHLYGGWWLPKELYKERVTVVGRIASLPQQGSLGTSFLLKLETINDESVNALIKLTGYVEAGVPLHLSVGDQWQFVTRLKPLHALHNFEGLDHTYYSILQGVRASGYIVTQADNRLLLSEPNYFPLLHLRQVIQQKIEQSLEQFPKEAAIISALTVGSTTSMTQTQWQVFRLTGTSHLVAISGLHIGLMAALGFFLFRMIGKILPRLFLKIVAPNLGAIGACLFALSYSALAGFAWPTQRALLMVLTLSLTQCCYRAMPLWRRLSLACVAILVLEPWALLSASFMLSFCAVAALAYGLGGRWQKLKLWRQWWQMQWVIFVLLLPISLYYFKQVSLVMLIANFIAIPWVAWLVVPLSLFACFLFLFSAQLAHSVLVISAYLLKYLWIVLTFFSQWPLAVWPHNLAHLWLLVVVSLGALLLVAPQGIPGRALACLSIGLLFFYQPARPQAGEWWLSLLDVGQGLAIVVQTQHHVMIYDTGVRYPGAFDAGRDVVLPFLEARHLDNIDLLVISHGDNDHSGGAASLVAAANIKQILSSIPEKFKAWWVNHCMAGQSWRWDGVDFAVLAPAPGAAYEGNDSSCVIKIQSAQGSALLTGDIQRNTEHYLLANEQEALVSDVLVAPHHGSLSSSIESFVQAVRPKIVLFATGFLNRYHFPHPKIVSLYQKYHVKMYSSARDGAIQLRFKPNGQLIVNTAIKHEKHAQL